MIKKLLLVSILSLVLIPSHTFAARKFTSGYEVNSTTAGVEWTGVSGTPVVSTTTTRTGQYSQKTLQLASGTGRYMQNWSISADTNVLFLRFYINIHTAPSAITRIMNFQMIGSPFTQMVRLNLNTDRTITLTDEDGNVGTSSALTADSWYCVQVKMDASGAGSTDVVEMRLDQTTCGTTVAVTSSTRNLSAGAGIFALGGNIGGEGATTAEYYFDDVAFNDSTGSTQTGYPGEGRAALVVPNVAGDNTPDGCNNTNPCGTPANSYQEVDEIPPDNATTFIDLDNATSLADYGVTNTTDIFGDVSTNYYFDASVSGPTDGNNVWTNDANASDSSESTTATISTITTDFTDNGLYFTGANAVDTGKNIAQVQVRLVGTITSTEVLQGFAYYSGTPLTTVTAPALTATGAGSWVTLDIPSGGWTISKVQNLEIRVYAVNDGSGAGIGQVQLRMINGIDTYDTVNLIDEGIRVREEAAAATGYEGRIKSASGGTTATTTRVDVGNTTFRTNPNGTSPMFLRHVVTTDPTTGIAWTPTGTNSIDNMQIGVGSVTANDIDVSTLWAYVEYVDGSAPAAAGLGSIRAYINGFINVNGFINIGN